ncbi:MAG: glycine dehydrogenase (aminomethyl-transferring), partial [Bacteroidota bacterium]
MENAAFNYREKFEHRHNGSTPAQVAEMLKTVGVDNLDTLIEQTVPANIRLKAPLNLPAAQTEQEFLQAFRALVSNNKVLKSFIGTGYYNTFTPGVILRNIMENPGWYTAYTPYQAEIAQGRLEALINYQTMVTDLTGMAIANASLLDEGTAAAEAMHMLFASRKPAKKNAVKFFADRNCFPQTLDVLTTRSAPIGIELVIGDITTLDITDPALFAVYVQNPADDGSVKDHSAFIAAAHEKEVAVVMGTDLLALTLMKSPGEMGADVVVGCSQRFGVPMGFGGPHAAFFATREDYKRLMPGRIIGASLDSAGNPAYRMALQTREQHIRREKATSNICTAQVLLSVMAGMYAVYHGPDGLRKIAGRVHALASALGHLLQQAGIKAVSDHYFDTLTVKVNDAAAIRAAAEREHMNFRYSGDGRIGISIDETSTPEDILKTAALFGSKAGHLTAAVSRIPGSLSRTSAFLTHPVFNTYQSEHEMLR